MIMMERIKYLGLLGLWLAGPLLSGCMNFTQRDYELQKKGYERQQQEKEAAKEGSVSVQW